MRDLFRGYYRPSPDEFAAMWNEGIFVFDTNVLLNIYRYTPNTRDDLFRIWEKLLDRIWIPYQAILEYFENREVVISQQYSIHMELEQSLDRALETVLNKYKKGHPFADIEAIKAFFRKTKEDAKAILQKGQENSPNIQDHDIFLERITQLFNDKVGDPYSDKQQKDLCECLNKRYEQMIPPGYKDAKKDSSKQNDDELSVSKYGDGIIWFQMIDYAKAYNKAIIFITDDVKDDWWRREKGKVLGPRPELIKEMYDSAKIDFYMYTADNFIKRAQELLGIQVRSETIKEVRNLRKQDEKKQEDIAILYSLISDLLKPRIAYNISDQELRVQRAWKYIMRNSFEKDRVTSLDLEKLRGLMQSHNDIWAPRSLATSFVSEEEASSAQDVVDDELKQENSDSKQDNSDDE